MGAREHSRSATVVARLKSVMPDLCSPVRWVAPRTEVGDHSKTHIFGPLSQGGSTRKCRFSVDVQRSHHQN